MWRWVLGFFGVPLVLVLHQEAGASFSFGGIFSIAQTLLAFSPFVAIPVWRIAAVRKYNTTIWPAEMLSYGELYQCNRCGVIGRPTDSGAAINPAAARVNISS